MRHGDEEAVTWADYRRLLRRVRELETRLGEAFEAVTTGDDAQAAFWDEHEDKINRMRRAQNRIEKRVEQLEYVTLTEDEIATSE
jgi:hypothetical protein